MQSLGRAASSASRNVQKHVTEAFGGSAGDGFGDSGDIRVSVEVAEGDPGGCTFGFAPLKARELGAVGVKPGGFLGRVAVAALLDVATPPAAHAFLPAPRAAWFWQVKGGPRI